MWGKKDPDPLYCLKNVKEESTSLHTWEHESFLLPNVEDSEAVSVCSCDTPGSLSYQMQKKRPVCLAKSWFLPRQKTRLDCCSGGLISDSSDMRSPLYVLIVLAADSGTSDPNFEVKSQWEIRKWWISFHCFSII